MCWNGWLCWNGWVVGVSECVRVGGCVGSNEQEIKVSRAKVDTVWKMSSPSVIHTTPPAAPTSLKQTPKHTNTTICTFK